MPTFVTPGPVALRIRNAAGRVHIHPIPEATESTVELSALNDAGRTALEQALVEQRDDTIVVEIPERSGFFARSPSVAIDVRVPVASTAEVSCGSADIVVGDGLRAVRATCGSGDVRVGAVDGEAQIKTGSGSIAVAHVDGTLAAATGSGGVTVSRCGPDATLRAGSGDIHVDEVAGTLVATTGSGDVSVRHLAGDLETKSGSGGTRIDHAQSGSIRVRSASGAVVVGLAEGTAAWLDLNTVSGRIDQQLDDREAPGEDHARLTVVATTVSGDIAIRRS